MILQTRTIKKTTFYNEKEIVAKQLDYKKGKVCCFGKKKDLFVNVAEISSKFYIYHLCSS